jgi:hypothetical protein
LACRIQAARRPIRNLRTPSQIFIFAVTGGAERWLKIPFDLSQSSVTYAEQALAVVRKTPFVQFFGRTTGFIVNYTPITRCVSTVKVSRSKPLRAHIGLGRSRCTWVAAKSRLRVWVAC